MKRKIRDIETEIKYARKEHLKRFGKRPVRRFMPVLYSLNELESLKHIEWLEGYLCAVRDERRHK